MTRHKIAQHERIYGTWDAKNSKEGPSNAKKSRVSFEHNSSSESDNEQGALVILANEDTLIREDCDDGTDLAQLSIIRSNSATLEVMYCLPFFGPLRVRIVRVLAYSRFPVESYGNCWGSTLMFVGAFFRTSNILTHTHTHLF